MFKAVVHLQRLRHDRLGELMLDIAEEQLEGALDAGPLAAAGIDPVEDLDTVALIIDTVDYQSVQERHDALDLPELEPPVQEVEADSQEDTSADEQRQMLAEVYGYDDDLPEPESALRSIAVVRGDIDNDAVINWVREQLPELHEVDFDGVTALGNEALAVAVIDDTLVATSGLVFIEDAAESLRGSGSLPLKTLLEGDAGGAHRIVNGKLDSLGDIMSRIGDALPDSVSGIRDIEISLDLSGGALSFLSEAQMSSAGAARVAVTALEGVRAAWAVAGFGKRMPGFRPAISNLKFVADDGTLRISLDLDDRESRSLVNEIIDILEEDLDEDW